MIAAVTVTALCPSAGALSFVTCSCPSKLSTGGSTVTVTFCAGDAFPFTSDATAVST